MAERPRITPAVVAELTGAAAKRLVRKLDQQPDLAEAWAWQIAADGAASVVTDKGETVTLAVEAGLVARADQVACSCLLSPRCLHALAVIHRLPLADGVDLAGEDQPVAEGNREAAASDGGDPPPVEEVVLAAEQREAIALAWQVAGRVLAVGGAATGAVLQADLLRAVHGCRASGLHRAAAAGLRLVRAIRDLREDRPEFELDGLTASLRELCHTALRLQVAGDRAVASALVGTARRRYLPIGSLRLYGLFTEPIVAASGYAGVVTYLCDGEGNLYTVSDVMPGEPERAPAAYTASAAIGDASLPHRALGREGLFVQNATASRDGRLGSGAAVKAVGAGPSTWRDDGPAGLWQRPLEEQLERARRIATAPFTERSAGWDLVFVTGRVQGATETALVVEVEPGSGRLVRCVAPSDHAVLGYRDNLRQLSRAPGLVLAMCGRVRFDEPRTIELLAAGPAFDPASAAAATGTDTDATANEESGQGGVPPCAIDSGAEAAPVLHLPSGWGGRFNLGLDPLRGAFFERAGEPAEPDFTDPELEIVDPLEPLRRRLARVALGGRATLPPHIGPAVEREALILERRLMKRAAACLRGVATAASAAERATSGVRRAVDAEAFASAWLRASVYELAASEELRFAAWL